MGAGVAQTELQTGPESPNTGNRLPGLWKDYVDAKSANDQDARERAFERILETKTRVASDVFEPAAYLFLQEGLKDLEAENNLLARQEFHHAIKLNPYLWPAYSGLAQIRGREEGKLSRYFLLDLKGFQEAFSLENSYFVMAFMAWLLVNLSWVFVIGFTLVVFVLGLKYVRPVYATTVGFFEHRNMKPLYVKLITFCLIVLPLGLGANFFLAAALYLIIFFPFFDTRERYVTVALMIFALSLPILNLLLANVNYARSDPLLKAHLTQFYEGDPDQRIAYLEANPGEGEQRHQSMFTIGRLLSAKGEYRRALEVFEEIPRASTFWPMAQVNIGNIQFFSQEYQGAIASYKKAVNKNAGMGVALYNLSVVHAKQGNHREAESFRSEAAKKAPSILARATLYNKEVVDAEPDYRDRLLQSLLSLNDPALKDWYLKPTFFMPAATIFLVFILALIHAQLRNARLLAKACRKCGRIFYPSDSPNSDWCSQCVNLYVKKEDLPSEAKNRKYQQVKAFNKLKRRIYLVSQLFLPGAQKIIRGGHAAGGALTIFVWVLLLILCLSPLTQVAHPLVFYLQDPLLITYFWIGVTVVYWIIFGLRPIWQEG